MKYRALLLFVFIRFPDAFPQTVEITGDNTLSMCETGDYTIRILNNSGNPLTNIVVSNEIGNLTGFSYSFSSTSMDIDGGASFCTADPMIGGTPETLTWDINSLCGTLTLEDGETLNISYSLNTDCDAVSGSQNVTLDYDISGSPASTQTSSTIVIDPGMVQIKMTPSVTPQVLGQNVTWTIQVENTGLGDVRNVAVTDVLGDGLIYVSSTEPNNQVGQTITWDPTHIPAFIVMAPGDVVEFDLTAQVTACENLDNIADVRWGCDLFTDCYNTAVDGGTATVSVQRIARTPLISFTPPDITLNYCQDNINVSFPLTNIGDGPAFDVTLGVDFGPFNISNLSAGAVYDDVNNEFVIANEIAPGGGVYNLSFDVNHTDWCTTDFPAGDFLWQPIYTDECGNEFYPPVELSTVNAPSGASGLTAGTLTTVEAIPIAGQVTFDVTSAYSGDINCGPGTTGPITVIDNVPAGFTVVNAGGGAWTPGAGGTGGTITWTYTPPAGLNTSIILQAPDRTECEQYCYQTFSNAVNASGTDCCGCPLVASGSDIVAIECEEGVDSEKTANPVTGERCNSIEYTNTYIFDSGNTVLLNDISFIEDAEYNQQYIPNSLSVNLTGSGDITGCTAITDNTPGGTLLIDFSGCTATVLDGQTLTITYQLQITEQTVTACEGRDFYSWSSLDLGATGGECIADGLIHETTLVSIQAPEMSLSISGLDNIIHKCEQDTITIELAQTSGIAAPKDVYLRLSGLNYYVVDPTATACGGVAPLNCTPNIVGDDYIWTFNDAFTGANQTAALQLIVQKRCTGTADLTATAYYDDACHDDATPDEMCSVTATETPALLLEGDLLIEKTPEVYWAAQDTAIWTVYLTNRGSGTAYNVWMDDVLGAGIELVDATVNNMTGVTITNGQDHLGAAINGLSISIDQMSPGERREMTITAHLVDCNNLTNDVSASWGCIGVECRQVVTDFSTVQIPAPVVINTNSVTTPLDICSVTTGTVQVKNAGQAYCYNLTVIESLASGLIYRNGSTRWRFENGPWNGPNPGFDPQINGNDMEWTSTQIPGLAELEPGQRLEIEYDIDVDCAFSTGFLSVVTQYENPCASVFNTAASNYAVFLNEPDIQIETTRSNEPVACGQEYEWTITVTNTSGFTVPVIWVEDVIGDGFTYSSSTGDPPFTSDNGIFDGNNTVAFELRNVNHNDTATLTVRAISDVVPCQNDLSNTATAWWGCGPADGSSASKPGVDPPDDALCLTGDGVSDTHTSTREPDISILNVNFSPTQIDYCNSSVACTLSVENVGPSDAYFLDVELVLPDGLTYVANSSVRDCGSGPAPMGDPTIIDNQLFYTNINNNGDNLCNAVPNSGIVTLIFSLRADCYVTADLEIILYYYDCCENQQYNRSQSVPITSNYPDIEIQKRPWNSNVDCGESQEWTITVTNNGTAEAQVVRVEDIMGDWMQYVPNTFVDVNGTGASIFNMGNNVYAWEFNNLAANGGSAAFRLQTNLVPPPVPDNCDNVLRRNRARVIWGCGTNADATDQDPTTTSYDCTRDEWVNSNNSHHRMANLTVTDISPVLNCAQDGSITGAVTVTVENTGRRDAIGPLIVQVTDGKGWTGTGTFNGPLGRNETEDVTIDVSGWQVDCADCSTPYVFDVVVDLNDALCECNETDNTLDQVSWTAPSIDLQVTSISFSNVTNTADAFEGTVDVTVENIGCEDAADFWVLLDTDGCFEADSLFIDLLAANEDTVLSFQVTDQWADCGDCDCVFTAMADHDSSICECDGGNNTHSELFSHSYSDLAVTNIIASVSNTPDNGTYPGTVQVDVANQGCTDVTGAEVELTCDCGQTFMSQTVDLAAGESTTLIFDFSTSCPTCNCCYTVTLDPSNAHIECNGINNQDSDCLYDAYTDLGDAPDPFLGTAGNYPTLLANNGAQHAIVDNFRLGTIIDAEPDGQGTANATGDDDDGFDDDDGILFNTPLVPGETAQITAIAAVPGQNPAFLNGWIDFNADGDWDDPGEHIVVNGQVQNGNFPFDFAVPDTAVLGLSYSRFRLSSQQDLLPTGPAPDGEVEDYVVAIREQPIAVNLATFTATIENDQILLEWVTKSELNNAGFNIYRSGDKERGYTQINKELIKGTGDAMNGATYRYEDMPVESGTYYYKLEDVETNGRTTLHDPIQIEYEYIPDRYALYQNYPNPFNPSTTIRYDLPEQAFVTLNIYDIHGQLVYTLVSAKKSAGAYKAVWHCINNRGNRVSNGVYFYRIRAGAFTDDRKMILLK